MSRGQFTIRTSSVSDRYLRAVDCPSRSHPMSPPSSHWNNKEAHLSSSGTASLSSSSRTPTPVRVPSRASRHVRSIATSPGSRDAAESSRLPRIRLFPATAPMAGNEEDTDGSSLASPRTTESSRSPRIRLFPATAPVAGNEEDTDDGSSLTSRRITETRRPGKQRKSSPEPTPRSVTMRQESSESNRGWRRRLEGTSGRMKASPKSQGIHASADSSWIKKKASPRYLGASPKRQSQEVPPQPLTAKTLRAQLTNSDPSSAPTEVMMNLSAHKKEPEQKSDFGGAPTEIANNRAIDSTRMKEPDQKSDFGGAPTEIATNRAIDSTHKKEQDQKSDFGGAPTEIATNRAIDRNRTGTDDCKVENDTVDESIEYALHQHKRERLRHIKSISQRSSVGDSTNDHQVQNKNVASVDSEVPGGRLGRHVDNFSQDIFHASDVSFQSKSLSSSVGVETGGRSIERAPVALKRVLESSPNRDEVETGGRSIDRAPIPLKRVLESPPSRGEATPAVSSRQNSQHLVASIGGNRTHKFGDRRILSGGTGKNVIDPNGESREKIQGVVSTLSTEDERVDNPFLVRYPVRDSRHSIRQEPQIVPDSPTSSGWTPVLLSSSGLDQENFHTGMAPSSEKIVQLLFSPDRVNKNVIDMVEFEPPKINRTTMLDDEMTSTMMAPRILDTAISKVGNVKNVVERAKENRPVVLPFGDSHSDKFTRKMFARKQLSSRKPPVLHPVSIAIAGDKKNTKSSTEEQEQDIAKKTLSMVQNRIRAWNKNDVSIVSDEQKTATVAGLSTIARKWGCSVTSQTENSSAVIGPATLGSKNSSGDTELSTTTRSYSVRGSDRNEKCPGPVTSQIVLDSQKTSTVTNSSATVRKWGFHGSTKIADESAGDVSSLSLRLSQTTSAGPESSANTVNKAESIGALPGNGFNRGEENAATRYNNTEGNSKRIADTHLSATVSPKGEAGKELKPIKHGDDAGKIVCNKQSFPRESGTGRNSSHRNFAPQEANKNGFLSPHVVGSVSMMRAMFESSRGDIEVSQDDDEMTTDSLDVKSIRSIFEDAHETAEKVDDNNAVTKIRSMFEQSTPQPSNEKTKMAVKNLETTVYKKSNSVREFENNSAGTHRGRKFANTTHQPSGQGTGSRTRGDLVTERSTANDDESKPHQSSSGGRPTIAERIKAMNLERNQSQGNVGKTARERFASPPVVEPRKLTNTDFRSTGAQSGGNGSTTKSAEEQKSIPYGGQHSIVSNKTSNRDHTRSSASSSQKDQPTNVSVKQERDARLNSRDSANRTTVRAGEAVPASVNSMRNDRHSFTPPSVSEKNVVSKWGSAVPGSRAMSGRDNQGYVSSLQGVIVKKSLKSEGPRVVHVNSRADSEGYDDGVTLDLSIAEVSCLTNPTCMLSKGDVSVDGTSSRVSKDMEVAEVEGLGPSEASSSQTSEAAAPLLALTMRTKFTNSSDDFGYFSQHSFGDRLSSGTQSKWVPLTAPIEENMGGAMEHTGDMSDPAWDLRNIKARFAERQAKKAAKESKRTRTKDKLAWNAPLGGKNEIDRWEPFESLQFPEAPSSLAMREKGGLKDDYGPVGDDSHVPKTVGGGGDKRGTPQNSSDFDTLQQLQSQRDKCRANRGSADAPSTGSTKLKLANQIRNRSQVVVQAEKAPRKRHPAVPESTRPYSQHAVLMSKLLSLREARIQRTTAFSTKISVFPSSRIGSRRTPSGFAPLRQPHFASQGQSQYSGGARGDDEEQSASTMSSTKFGGHKFEDCLDID